MICVNDRLYVAGGEHEILAWYILSTDTWIHGAKPRLCHFYGAVFYQNNNIVVVGGADEWKVESFDLDTGVWSVCNWKMPRRLKDLRALMIN